ncbi:hypothetical protein SAMN05421670_0810 [Psychrobacillus psychrotolerans]|uniref:Uncharacterized protein n=1 Tax=Psychrobacillus psychrotolerans TaxID=126156 RepID=A0A1I5VGM4_9BACI|nr:hypothetical protein [Psychrobacillus psychrotolerans]SFQ06708.1 hypothetical protein SAMN05421670_0810 [Psychrobacillus psychrotolerans]
MENLKDFFKNNIRFVLGLIVYVVGIFVILSINFNSFNLTQKIIITSIAAIIFVVINKLLKRNKVNKI